MEKFEPPSLQHNKDDCSNDRAELAKYRKGNPNILNK